ncbi:MAG: GTP-binding protein [Promethearchaeota archaeon]
MKNIIKTTDPQEIIKEFEKPNEYVLLIKGETNTGKTSLSLELLQSYCNSRGQGLYISTKIMPRSLYLEYPWLKTYTYKEDNNFVTPKIPENDYIVYQDIPDLLAKILDAVEDLEGAVTVVIDNLDMIFERVQKENEALLDELQDAIIKLSEIATVNLIIVIDREDSSILDDFVDGIIVLKKIPARYVKIKGEKKISFSTLTKDIVKKFVIAGPFSSGKTTFLKALCEKGPWLTEEGITVGKTDDKQTTTVAIEYGYRIVSGKMIHFFGTPGIKRFEAVWDFAASGIDGLFLVVDSANLKVTDVKDLLSFYRRYGDFPIVVVANKQDLSIAKTPEEIRSILGLTSDIPVIGVVAKEEKNVEKAFQALLNA